MNENSNEELNYVKGILEKEKIEIEQKLKVSNDLKEKANLIGQINLIKFSQELLRRCFEYDVIPKAVWRRIPMPQHEWSEYRLMEDNDTDNKEYWRKESSMRFTGGEIVIG